MKISVVIICHNQDHIVNINIAHLLHNQTIKPDHIIVVDDCSSLCNISNYPNVHVLSTKHNNTRGRSAARNMGIKKALDLKSDYVIFMDGDMVPLHNQFIEIHVHHLKQNPLGIIFGFRQQVPSVNWKNQVVYADSKAVKDSNESEDPRLIAKIYPVFNELTELNEQVNYVLSGWVTWSCNFSMSSDALNRLNIFTTKHKQSGSWFDEGTFSEEWGWGNEDGAFGLDNLYAGNKIILTNTVTLAHLMHESKYIQLKSINGNALLFNRLRKYIQS